MLEKVNYFEKDLVESFQNSGLSIDEFILAYLKDKGIENPEKALAEINSTFAGIDKNYEDLKKCKAEGGNRKTFLRRICDNVTQNTDPQKAGEALAIITAGLNNADQPENSMPYDGLDAVSCIDKLEKAIKKNALNGYDEEK